MSNFDLMKKVKEMNDAGKSTSEICNTVKKSEHWVALTLAIMSQLPVSVHEALEKSIICRETALQLLYAPLKNRDAIIVGAIELADGKKEEEEKAKLKAEKEAKKKALEEKKKQKDWDFPISSGDYSASDRW